LSASTASSEVRRLMPFHLCVAAEVRPSPLPPPTTS